MFFKQKNLVKEFLPNHLSIIMDGNRRWAKKKLLNRKVGHYEGAKNLKKIITECITLGIKYLTVYAFSTENWNREKKEINELMNLLNSFLDNDIEEIINNEVRINVIGNLTKFPKEIRERINNIESKTKKFKKFCLNIALNYGSREEIVSAVNTIINTKFSKKELTEKDFSQYLYTHNIPDPDLMIRTSGEYRLSNFLLWQSAYSELYFSKKYWPEFNEKELHKALLDYAMRKRRFGK